jgi:phosphoribosylaminoimidazole-succinocarboxamide synthase
MEQIFADNPRFNDPAPDLFRSARRQFSALPLYHLGRSKELRFTGQVGLLIQRFLPTLDSYTSNRAGSVPGTDRIRMAVSRIFWQRLHQAAIPTCVLQVEEEFALVTEERVPPVEVIVKAALVGTPAHIYHDLFARMDRFNMPFSKGERHQPYCRFDYRNPIMDDWGGRLRDEQLPLALADRFLDVAEAQITALRVFDLVQESCQKVGFRVLDLCLLLDEAGRVVCGELSPDNMRIKRLASGEDCDKDIWRRGGDPQELLARWRGFQEALEASHGTS